ncbi:MAG: phospholipid carrier-dependent glycosyltransferase [Candidatus Melainabacteria bacterium]|nr:MAG: phospholipid carrier-dependent glycosyltransferase [Candidatus Melainabacteria bacterium]
MSPNVLSPEDASPKKPIELLAVAILLLLIGTGAFMRFEKLDDKEFWHDESFTALVLSGRTTSEMKSELSTKPCQISDLTKYRTINDSTSAGSILHSLGEDEPGHAPLFYFIEWAFCSVLGTTPLTMRLTCALISLLTLPVFYWLALETYQSKQIALLTTAFASLSPLLIYYAQEARDYSLGVLLMTLSSALLLAGLRTGKKAMWIGYTAALAIGLYSWLFTTIIVAAHILYVAITQPRGKTVWLPFAISIAVACLTFTPWLIFLSAHSNDFKRAYDWVQAPITKSELLSVWLAIPYKAFALFGFKTAKLSAPLLLVTMLQTAAVALAAIPFRNTKYIHIAVIVTWLVVFAGQDVLTEGARSAVFRYQTAIIVSILFLFSALIEFLWKKTRLLKGLALLVVTFTFGIELLSDNYMLNCKIWPDKAINLRFTLPVAEHLNKEPSAVLVVEEQTINPTELLDLSFQTHPDCPIIFLSADKPQTIPAHSEILYLLNPSERLTTELSSKYEISDSVDKFPYLKRAQKQQ